MRMDVGGWGSGAKGARWCRGVGVRKTYAVVSLVLLLVCLAAADASLAAGPSRSYSTSFGNGHFTGSNPQALTVDQSSGDIYLINAATSSVERYTAGGSPDNFTCAGCSTNSLSGFSFGISIGKAEIAVDNSGGPADGDVYVTDTVNNQVKVFASDGEPLITLTGTEDPNGAFNQPCGVAVDQSDGDVYVADQSQRVWRYTPAGATPAETDYSGGIDPGFVGCQLAAEAGRVYLGKYEGSFNEGLSRFRASTFAVGTPPTPSGVEIDTGAAFIGIKAVAVDPLSGNVYADRGSEIAVFQSGAPGGSAPLYTFGAGDFASSSPGVAVKSGGNAYVADRHNGGKEVDVYGPQIPDPSRSYSTSFGNGHFTGSNPQALTVDQSSGDIYLINSATSSVERYTAGGSPDNFTCAGCSTNSLSGFSFGISIGKAEIAVDNSGGPADGDVYVTDTVNNQVKVFASDGEPLITLTGTEDPNGAFNQPCGVAVDQSDGDVYVADQSQRVWRYTPAGATPAETDYSGGIDPGFVGCQLAAEAGRVYLGKYEGSFNEGLSRFRASTFAVGTPPTPSGVEIDTGAAFIGIKAVAVDPLSGNVYADRGSEIAVFQSGAPGGSAPLYTFGAGDFASSFPGVAVKSGGNAYVADRHNGGKEVDVYGPEVYGKLLNVFKDGSGSGLVSGGSAAEPGAIDCGATCESAFLEGTEVTLTAMPEAGSNFAGWSGCESTSGAEGEVCTVTMDSDTGVTATFVSEHLTVAKVGTGTGTVTATPNTGPEADAAIDCGATCEAGFQEGTEVDLTATAAGDSHLAGWTSGCDSVGGPDDEVCTVTMDEDHEVTASFFKPKLKVLKAPSGSGTVESNPAGISCGGSCESLFGYGSTALLTPTPASGSAFVRWAEGECDAILEEDKCEVTLSEDREVEAIFGAAPRVTAESFRAHDTSARLKGSIDPESETTKYRFQYVTEAHYQAEAFLGADSVPVPASELEPADSPVDVAAVAEGLIPSTAYRFRLVAINPLGEDSGEAVAFATHASESAFGACPNQAFREAGGPSVHLADCRAYEQASPVDKNGGTLQAYVALTKASLAGDGITFESGAGIPGGEGAQNFPIYMASRSADGWSTQGLYPPASYGESGSVLGWTPDFALAFSRVRFAPGEYPQALLERRRNGEPVSELVPFTSPAPGYQIVGSSANDSEVVFSAQGVLSVKAGDPAPASGKTNVYAADRTAAELSLVGILPDGTVPVGGSSAIGGYAQEMNVVSRDGSVFFTAGGTNQIYLREHPTEPETTAVDGEGNCVPDPILACTVAVEASQASEPDPDGPFEPTFRGASAADSSSAFFTSKEELTDNAHTTAQVAVARGDLDGGDVLPDFAPHADAVAIATDVEYIYWADPGEGNPGEGRIGRVGIDGEGAEPDFITGANNPLGVAVTGGHIYWTNAGEDENHNSLNPFNAEGGSIGRAALNGASAASQVNQSFIADASYPMGIDTDGTYLYWVNRAPAATSQTIARATLDGSNAAFGWFQNNPHSRAYDIAVDATHNHLYTVLGTGPIVRTSLTDPNTASELLTASGANEIAVAGDSLYYTHAVIDKNGKTNVHAIARADLDGQNASDLITAEGAQGIAVGGSQVYWGSHPTPSTRGADLYRYQAGGSGLADLTPDKADVLGAEVQGVLGVSDDGKYVYFVANGVLASGAAPGSCNGGAGTCNLYVWHEDPETHAESTEFIARLDGKEDFGDWTIGPLGLPRPKVARVSKDGRTVLFGSTRPLGAYDNEGKAELYRYGIGDAAPTCISCNPTGAPPVGPATVGSIEPSFIGASIQMNLLSRNLSGDGNRIFFETPDALVAADTNGDEGCPGWGSGKQASHILSCQDVYEWEAKGSGSCDSEAQNGGCLYLIFER